MMILQVLDERDPARSNAGARRIAVQWKDSATSASPRGCLALDLTCNDDLHATLLEALGETYLEHGAYARAVSAFEECLDLRRKLFGQRHIAVAQTQRRLACALRYDGAWKRAYDEIHATVETLSDLLGRENTVYADAILERALIHLMAHRLSEARADAVTSRKIFEAKGDIRRFQSMDVEARVIEVCAAQGVGSLDAAREIYREILESPDLPTDHPWRPTFVHNEGTILHALGDYVGARDNFTRAIEAWECGSAPRPEQIDAYINRGRASRALKDFEAARTDVETAIRLDTELRGPRHPYVAYDLVGLANLLIAEDRESNTKRALKALEEAIAIYRANKLDIHAYLEAALRLRYELTRDEENQREADRIRDALQNSCGMNPSSCE